MKAVFGVPDPAAIRREGLVPVDLHFHTNCSDSFTDPFRALRLAERRGVGLAVTDHNLISSLIRIHGEERTVPLIPGMEVSTTDGPHVLVYFYSVRDIEKFWFNRIRPRIQENPWLAIRDCPVSKLLDFCEKESCVVSAAHPAGYFNTNKGVEICVRKGIVDPRVRERLDAYEVISGGMTRMSNLAALGAAETLGLGFTGGSDAHVMSDLGGVVTVVESESVEGILEDIRHRRTTIVGQEKDIKDKVLTGQASARRFAEHAPSTVSMKAREVVKR